MATGSSDSAIVAFGCNDDGQLGRGERRSTFSSLDAVSAAHLSAQIEALAGVDVAAVSCGSRHTMALSAAGEVFSWGWGSMGQLGHGDLKSSNTPRRIAFFAERGLVVDYISCGGCHSAAVTRDGTLYMWGEAHWGQLGLSKELIDLHQSLPVKCPVLQDGSEEKIVKISCGGAHTAALTDKGHVYMWGRCDSGQLGIDREWLRDSDDDSMLGSSRPHRVDGFGADKVVQVACGAFHSAAVTDSGAVYIWGKEDYGMLGVGQSSDVQRPQRIEFFDTLPALRVSCGGWHTVVVTKSGACYSFGRGEYGRLGLGDTKSRYKPQQVDALKGEVIVQAACGGSHTLFLTKDGVAFSSGRADHGRLGDADLKTVVVPQALNLGSHPVCQVSAGGAHSVALMHSSRGILSPLLAPLPSILETMCALFYDYAVQIPSSHRHVCSTWGEADPILAVALENREVHFFSDEGEKNSGSEVYTRSADIVAMAWQPRGAALAIGWSDGMVSLWIPKENSAREVNSPHAGRVGLLRWAPAGNRLVSADENGVDNFSQHACPKFFFGGEIGSVHYADDLDHITDIQTLNHAIDAMMFYEEHNRLIVITRGLQLHVFQVGTADGTVKGTFKVKLSVAGDGCLHETRWAGPSLLAIASGEPLVRFWDLQAEENNVLSLPKSGTSTYQVNSLDFSPRKRILVAGTAQGVVFFWRCVSLPAEPTKAAGGGPTVTYRWDIVFTTEVGGSVARVGWSPVYSTLYANTSEGVTILHEGNMQRVLCGDTAVIQSHPKTLSIEKFRDGTVTQSTLETSLPIKGVSHDTAGLLLWSGSKAEVYELRNGDAKRAGQFKCDSRALVIRGDSVYRTSGNHVEVCNFQGVVKNTISFTEAEGRPALLSLQNKFLAVGTDRGFLRVFDLSRRDPKAVGSMGSFLEAYGDETSASILRVLAVNADGTRVCILADKLEGTLKIRVPMSALFLFQTDLNIFQRYDFGAHRSPNLVFFDPQEPRLLACESTKGRADGVGNQLGDLGSRRDGDMDGGGGGAGSAAGRASLSDKEITVLFASNDHGLLMQDSFDLELKYNALLGIQAPRVYFIAQAEKSSSIDPTTVVKCGSSKDRAGGSGMSRASPANNSSAAPFSYLCTKLMRDFVGLDKVDEKGREALINFCYFVTIGNMDEAYRSVKLIENPSVWENMAHMCVKTKRVDVAEVCLGNMGHARGAAAVKEAALQPQVEVPIAMVAIQLGLRDDAARLYRECGRYDLLNKLYQASGFWQKAVDVAAKRDRIHLKTTHYAIAQHYEEMGDVKQAMEAYEDAGTHQKDIPRMLFKLGKLELLQKYVATSSDRDVRVWWAQFQESQGHFDAAIESYEKAKDFLSVVRVLCFKKDFQAAAKVVKASANRAAAYHLARQFEAHGDTQSAIHFFAAGGCYNHAIRLAKEHRLDAELMSFALMSTPGDMLECAAYFEARREMEKAVQLYHKGGDVARALDLCFQAQLFEELHHLTDELGGSSTSPALLKKCADFFISNGHFAKAVHLCLIGSRVSEALDVCLQHGVKVTEEMAERMTPPKDDKDGAAAGDKAQQKRRTDLLLKLAKCCKKQGAYHLATKKYTQAGDKLRAMKCLLKSGDTEKIVFFANVSRNNEIFILAANYLQNLDWRQDGEILKNIVGFYSKARAFEQLAGFYSGCAQVEIEEYRDYEKAIGAVQEAVKVLSKARSETKDKLLKALETRILLMEQFVVARQQLRQNPSELVEVVLRLLDEPGVDEAIRVGDALALLADAYYEQGDRGRALETLEAMKKRGLALKNYVDPRLVQDVYQKMDVASDSDAMDKQRKLAPSERKMGADDDEEANAGQQRVQSSGSLQRPTTSGGRKNRDDDEDDMEEDIEEED
ncbi:hypothetical protein PybrP1_001141 [[Pythium] brassicae (nom. inval.)]|nr:hypothetical protein PybrP1_001141 [[Pythium] brassicae (nom. inval.)]